MQIVSHSRMFFLLLLLLRFRCLHGISYDWLLTRTMLLFFSACPVIVWMLFLERKKKMRVQWWIVAYTIVSIQRKSAGGRKIKHCIIMIFGLAVHLKSVHILPVRMRRKFRCTTTHKNSRRTYIFETDFKIISLILQCSSVYCMDGIEQVKAIGCGGGILVRKKSQFTRQPYQIFMISKPIKSRNFH